MNSSWRMTCCRKAHHCSEQHTRQQQPGATPPQPTVCAHFLPDRSTSPDTSCGNTSPAALGMQR